MQCHLIKVAWYAMSLDKSSVSMQCHLMNIGMVRRVLDWAGSRGRNNGLWIPQTIGSLSAT
jgi:hypothetical protein